MAFKGISTLKTYFTAGAIPTANNFADLIESTHTGQTTYTLIDTSTGNSSIDTSEVAGGIIHVLGVGGTTSAEQVIKLPAAATANIGLQYKLILGSNVTNLRVGPDGTTTKLSGSLNLTSYTSAKVIAAAAPVSATHISFSSADIASGGTAGSVVEFFYNSATGVTVTGTVFNANTGTLTGVNVYGTGDIG
jgi:hypothetical protein